MFQNFKYHYCLQVWEPAWFNARQSINWDKLSSYPYLSENSLSTINKNELEGEDLNPWTNEIAERVFRMVNEKYMHCKSFAALEDEMILYFNDKNARLN